MADLTLIGADVLSTALIVRERFDPAQSRGAWAMQDLKNQFVTEKVSGCIRAGLSTTDHGCFEHHIVSKPCQLSVDLVGILFDRQQPIPKQCFSDRRCVEGAIADEFVTTVVQKTHPVQQWLIVGIGFA